MKHTRCLTYFHCLYTCTCVLVQDAVGVAPLQPANMLAGQSAGALPQDLQQLVGAHLRSVELQVRMAQAAGKCPQTIILKYVQTGLWASPTLPQEIQQLVGTRLRCVERQVRVVQ